MPIYCAVHLWTSPTAALADKKKSTTESMIFNPTAVRFLPVSVTVGYTVPSILMALPSPIFISHDLHQVFIALWQLFAVWIGLCQLILPRIISPSNQSSNSREVLKGAYTFAMTLTLVINVATIALVGFSSSFPWGSQEPFFQKMLSVFVPIPLTEAVTPDTLGKGCLALLQYDVYFACAATLLWALSLYGVVNKKGFSFSSVLKLLCASVVLGPGGTSLLVMWQRDEHLLEGTVKSAAKQA